MQKTTDLLNTDSHKKDSSFGYIILWNEKTKWTEFEHMILAFNNKVAIQIDDWCVTNLGIVTKNLLQRRIELKQIWRTWNKANANLKLFNIFSSFLKIMMTTKLVVS